MAFKYPKRAILCLALFIGQAFLYNAITFDLGTILTTYFKIASGPVPYFLVLFAIGNFLGPLTLGSLFDTVGRRIMVSACYIGSAAGGVALVVFLLGGSHSQWIFIGLVCLTFFLASAGASAAYLTVSEIFPMETRALAIAFFYAVGTAIGGIGPAVDLSTRASPAENAIVRLASCAAGLVTRAKRTIETQRPGRRGGYAARRPARATPGRLGPDRSVPPTACVRMGGCRAAHRAHFEDCQLVEVSAFLMWRPTAG